MKKIALSLAISAALPGFAIADTVEIEVPDFYGKINISVQNTQEGGASISEVSSNASRLGLKGKIDLKHGLKGIYKLEYQTAVDDGDNGKGQTFKQRNAFAGIKGGFGKVVAGFMDTPLKKTQKKVDLFNDLEGDIKSIITNSENRLPNIVKYNSPKFMGLVATVAHVASEDETVNDGTSSSLTYNRNKIYAAVGYDTDVEANGIDVTRVVAQYSIVGITFGALWETQVQDGDNKDGWVYSAAYKLNSDVKLKAQYGESDIAKDNAKTYSLGVDYKLAKGAKVYAFATDEDFDESMTNEYYGIGLEYKF